MELWYYCVNDKGRRKDFRPFESEDVALSHAREKVETEGDFVRENLFNCETKLETQEELDPILTSTHE